MKLRTVVDKYVRLRRSLGMRFRTPAEILDAYCRAIGDVPIATVRTEAVGAFLRGKGGLTSTWHQKHGTLKSFYRFAVGRGYAVASPLPTTIPRHPPAFTPHIYPIEELRRILAAVRLLRDRDSDVPPISVRALILLLYGAGLRLSEATSLRFADIDLQEAVLIIHDGKFFKERMVPFSRRLATELDSYLRRRRRWGRPMGRDSAFFAMHDGRALKRDSIEGIWRRLCALADVRSPEGAREQPRLHDLRHTFAVHRLVSWYRQGADVQRLVYFLQVYLGHEKLAYTQRYLTMTPELLAQANRRFENYISREVNHD